MCCTERDTSNVRGHRAQLKGQLMLKSESRIVRLQQVTLQYQSGKKCHAFGKLCFCLGDTCHFRNFVVLGGFEQQCPCFCGYNANSSFSPFFVKTPSFRSFPKAPCGFSKVRFLRPRIKGGKLSWCDHRLTWWRSHERVIAQMSASQTLEWRLNRRWCMWK